MAVAVSIVCNKAEARTSATQNGNYIDLKRSARAMILANPTYEVVILTALAHSRCVYIYIYMYIYIHIYTQRERERTIICMYIYIHT